MKKTIAYIAHPIAGDVMGNIEKIMEIVREINLTEPDVVPFAPYVIDVLALDDDKPEERAIGIDNCIRILMSGIVNELWIYGDRISGGMLAEIEMAFDLSIPVILMNEDMEVPTSIQSKITEIRFK